MPCFAAEAPNVPPCLKTPEQGEPPPTARGRKGKRAGKQRGRFGKRKIPHREFPPPSSLFWKPPSCSQSSGEAGGAQPTGQGCPLQGEDQAETAIVSVATLPQVTTTTTTTHAHLIRAGRAEKESPLWAPFEESGSPPASGKAEKGQGGGRKKGPQLPNTFQDLSLGRGEGLCSLFRCFYFFRFFKKIPLLFL